MDKTSKYFGVNWDKRKNKWTARVSFEGKRICVGQFNSDEEAFNEINLKKKELGLKIQSFTECTPLENEVFKSVPSFEDYEVSNLGRVKSLKNGKEKILKSNSNGRGYLFVTFFYLNKSKKYFNLSVHKLVAMSFLGHKPDGTHKIVVDHIDNDKSNNKLSNLQLISHRENCSKDRINTSSKYTGSSWCNKKKKWKCYIQNLNKKTHLGYFDIEEEASEYYKNAVKAIENGEKIVIKRRDTSSKYNGVRFCPKNKNWRSSFTLKGRTKHIGVSSSEYEAYIQRENFLKNNKLN
jgi:hypothetical protein